MKESKAVPTPDDLERVGNCYENAVLFILANSWLRGAFLVHGRPIRAVEPFCQYGHAWIELGESVIDVGTGFHVPKSRYYEVGKIDPDLCVKYPFLTALKMAKEFGHYGPWEGVDASPPFPPAPRAPLKTKGGR